MPVGGTFLAARPLDPKDQRPYASVSLRHPTSGKSGPKLICLVDTGSDWTVFPAALANASGVIVNGPPIAVRTANGTAFSLLRATNVELIIQGYLIVTTIAVSQAGAFTPIVGRRDLLTAFDLGFTTTHWHWG